MSTRNRDLPASATHSDSAVVPAAGYNIHLLGLTKLEMAAMHNMAAMLGGLLRRNGSLSDERVDECAAIAVEGADALFDELDGDKPEQEA